MADGRRSVSLTRLETGVYEAHNGRGGTLRFGSMAGEGFTPVELLLAAIGGCSAVDIDVVTARRVEPTQFEVVISADTVREEHGNRLTDIHMVFSIAFPEGPKGDAARAVAPAAARASHDTTCTVSRTIELGTPVRLSLAPPAEA